MKRVLIAYKDIPQYRVRFFEELRERLLTRDIELRLTYGQPARATAMRKDSVAVKWAQFRPIRSFDCWAASSFGSPFSRDAHDATWS